jgi:flagellar basal-body rod protein FlgC
MAFLDSMDISASALTATRLRMDVIAENMANSNTTRTENGEPYRRKYVVFQEKTGDSSFERFYKDAYTRSFWNRVKATGDDSWGKKQTAPGGVRVIEIGEDMSEFKYDYNPSHPDADENGYVRYPNVEVVQEMVDMMAAYRAYEANITAINTLKDMALKTLEIGK